MSLHKDTFKLLITGIDTLECAYFLVTDGKESIDYTWLSYQKEALRQSKTRQSAVITLGGSEYLLHPYGSSSGYPYIIENEDFIISFGEFNNPSFFVKFKSHALWHAGAQILHDRFMAWANRLNLIPYQRETLSRVDFSFDYLLPHIDFTENDVVSLSKKDATYRQDRRMQTIQYGKGDIVLRIYDKVAEIKENSDKTWFFPLWGADEDVWRIEWQVRKAILKRFGIRTLDDLQTRQGDLLRYLVDEHDSLRVPIADGNRARWPLHPLWTDLQKQIQTFNCLGVYRDFDREASLEERRLRIAISVYGYLKRLAAIDCVVQQKAELSFDDAMKYLYRKVKQVHDPFSWEIDVEKKIKQMQFSK